MVFRIRAVLARVMAAIVTAAVLVPSVAFAGGAIAYASVDCGIGDPPWYAVTVTTKDVLDTHTPLVVSLAPGTSATQTITKADSITAGIAITVGASAEAGVIFASASAKVGVTLKGEYKTTSGTSVSLTANNNTGSYHDYIFVKGTRTAKGTWTKYYCSAGVAKVYSAGTWWSWDAQYAAVLRCDQDSKIASTYGTWSVQYDAVRLC